jgi:glycosyltransferase involved in cell wall biosynthesis
MIANQTPSQDEGVRQDNRRDAEMIGKRIRNDGLRFAGKRAAMVVFSEYPSDPRPRRAAEALLEEGMRIDLICERGTGSKKKESVGLLHITRIPITHERGGPLAYAYQYSAFILLSTLILAWRTLRGRYDLVYVHNMPDILVICALFPKLFGAKVILDQHDPMPELMMTIFNMQESSNGVRIIRALEKWSLKRANRVITVNDTCRNLFSARGCQQKKIRVVMNSPNEKLFPFREPRPSPPRGELGTRRFTVMYHGTIVERNGLDLAVEAIAEVRKSIPNIDLNVYGADTSFLQRVLQRAREMDLEDIVHYRGRKRLEDLITEIDACDVGVIPNCLNAFTEINTPTRIFEYLALGKPVIAPRTRGIQDYFTPKSLFFFEPGSSADLAQQIKYVSLHPSEATETVERGQQVYLTHTWSQEKQRLLDVVDELLMEGQAS